MFVSYLFYQCINSFLQLIFNEKHLRIYVNFYIFLVEDREINIIKYFQVIATVLHVKSNIDASKNITHVENGSLIQIAK